MTGYGFDKSNLIPISEKLRVAFSLLLEASQYADKTNSNYWDFAVEMNQLVGLGLNFNDFRYLVRNDWVEHQREVTFVGDNGRTFRPTGDLSFPAGTCFKLTPKGIAFASDFEQPIAWDDVRTLFVAAGPGVSKRTDELASKTDGLIRETDVRQPSWDPVRRLLRLDGVVVKQFKWAAMNQEAVLAAFEEENWPLRIDDPLSPQPEQDSKRRLADTIKCLNRKQKNALIHFRGDGTGEGVIWEFVEPNINGAD